MYKIYILIFTVIIILIIGNMCITREGFYQTTTTSAQNEFEFEECKIIEVDDDKDCNKIEADNTEFLVHNVCPVDPKCLGICVNNFTWTEENKNALGFFDRDSFKLGELKSNDDKIKALLMSSRCGECIKNFYSGINLLQSNVGCPIIE